MTTQPGKPEARAGKKSGPLSFIQPRVTQRAVQARSSRTTLLVARLRLVLPIGGLLLLVVLVIWPMIDPNKIKSMVIKNIPDLMIEDLHFTGRDSKNQPYSLTAQRATRPGGFANLYDFNKPEGEMTLKNGAWVAGRAQFGRYDQSSRRLWLGGDVELFHDKGYQFTTDEAQVDIDENDAWGEKPVLIQGDFGEIRGKGFRVLDSGKTVVVMGPAKAMLNLHTNGPSDKPAGATKP